MPRVKKVPVILHITSNSWHETIVTTPPTCYMISLTWQHGCLFSSRLKVTNCFVWILDVTTLLWNINLKFSLIWIANKGTNNIRNEDFNWFPALSTVHWCAKYDVLLNAVIDYITCSLLYFSIKLNWRRDCVEIRF